MEFNEIIDTSKHTYGTAELYSDRIVIKNKVTFVTLLSNTVAERTIFFKQIENINKFNKSAYYAPHIQFDLLISSYPNSASANVNQIIYRNNEKEMDRFYLMILAAFKNFKSNSSTENTSKESPIDKLKKLKELLDLGIISQEEFNTKKEKLMSDI